MNRRPCRECGTQIFFIQDKHGVTQVLDAVAPVWQVTTDLTGFRHAVRTDAFVSHWSTCPKRDELKKKMKGQHARQS